MELATGLVSRLFTRAPTAMEERGVLLDPFSVLVVLATNAHKPIGTKLSVSDCKIVLHDVSLLQGAMRLFYGDTKANVKLLHYPIIHACRIVALSYQDDEDVFYLLRRARKGLENLLHTYREDRDIKSCVTTYMNIIQTTIDKPRQACIMLDMLLDLDATDGIHSIPDDSVGTTSPDSISSPSLIGGTGSSGNLSSLHSITNNASGMSGGGMSGGGSGGGVIKPAPHKKAKGFVADASFHTPPTVYSPPAEPPSPLIKPLPPTLATAGTSDFVGFGTASAGRRLNDISAMRRSLYSELHRIWDQNKLSVVIGLLRDLESCSPAGAEHMFVAIENFMEVLYQKTRLIVDSIFEQSKKHW